MKLLFFLSGAFPLENKSLLPARWTKKERHRSRDYLSQLLGTIGIEAEEHAYEMANSNPGIDMIFEPFHGANIYGTLPATKTELGPVYLNPLFT